jgi:hypothetical protein
MGIKITVSCRMFHCEIKKITDVWQHPAMDMDCHGNIKTLIAA